MIALKIFIRLCSCQNFFTFHIGESTVILVVRCLVAVIERIAETALVCGKTQSRIGTDLLRKCTAPNTCRTVFPPIVAHIVEAAPAVISAAVQFAECAIAYKLNVFYWVFHKKKQSLVAVERFIIKHTPLNAVAVPCAVINVAVTAVFAVISVYNIYTVINVFYAVFRRCGILCCFFFGRSGCSKKRRQR